LPRIKFHAVKTPDTVARYQVFEETLEKPRVSMEFVPMQVIVKRWKNLSRIH
jgi:hypothetical protein